MLENILERKEPDFMSGLFIGTKTYSFTFYEETNDECCSCKFEVSSRWCNRVRYKTPVQKTSMKRGMFITG